MADQKYCQNCGTPNLPDAKFCATCGASVTSASTFAVKSTSPSGTAPSGSPSTQQPPSTSPPESQKTSLGLRILEIIAGIIVLALGAYVIAYPGGVTPAVLVAFLAVGLLIISGMGFVRAFQEGISGRRRLLNLILWIIALLLAIAVLVYPLTYGSLILVYLLGLGLIFAGFASIARGTPATMVIGIIGIILAILTFVAIILYPPQGVELSLGVVLALVFVALALIIFGLEAIASGVVGRWV